MPNAPWPRLTVFLALAALAAGLAAYIHHENTALTVRRYTLPCADLPPAFEGYTIVQLSDLHGSLFGEGQKDLLDLVRRQDPDLIALTGDMVDGRRKQTGPAMALFRGLAAIAPCYSIRGNHEWYLTGDERALLEAGMTQAGIFSLNGKGVALARGDSVIFLAGLDDPTRLNWYMDLTHAQWLDRMKRLYNEQLDLISAADGPSLPAMRVLLCHHPLFAPIAASQGWDVVLSGHTHGGVVGLPGGYGLVSPEGGLFGRAGGILQVGQGWSVISRGLGNSVIPIRIACPLEVVVVTLTSGDGGPVP